MLLLSVWHMHHLGARVVEVCCVCEYVSVPYLIHADTVLVLLQGTLHPTHTNTHVHISLGNNNLLSAE